MDDDKDSHPLKGEGKDKESALNGQDSNEQLTVIDLTCSTDPQPAPAVWKGFLLLSSCIGDAEHLHAQRKNVFIFPFINRTRHKIQHSTLKKRARAVVLKRKENGD
jgi:hypothetical protein